MEDLLAIVNAMVGDLALNGKITYGDYVKSYQDDFERIRAAQAAQAANSAGEAPQPTGASTPCPLEKRECYFASVDVKCNRSESSVQCAYK